MKTAVLILTLALAGCGTSSGPPGVFRLTDDQVRRCAEQGGCNVFSKTRILEMMEKSCKGSI